MKTFKILMFGLLCLVAIEAKAQVTAADLMGAGMPAEQAAIVAGVFTSGAVVANNAYIKALNAAGSGTLSLLRADASDNTEINAATGKVISLSVNSVEQVALTDGVFGPITDNDIDLGTGTFEFKDAFFDGTLTTDILTVDATSTLTGNALFGGTLIGTGTATIGWAVKAGANTACTTTCTTPCVFGVNTAATEADIVDCADATADECLCAGAT